MLQLEWARYTEHITAHILSLPTLRPDLNQWKEEAQQEEGEEEEELDSVTASKFHLWCNLTFVSDAFV